MDTSHCMNTRQWYYLDASNSQKGPIPMTILRKLIEKGLGLTMKTFIWRSGMSCWQSIDEVEEMKDLVVFLSKQWLYLEEDQVKGPVNTRFILHKMKQGEIDGLTMICEENNRGKYQQLATIDCLREAISKIAQEEEAAELALNSVNTTDVSNDQFTFHSDDFSQQPAIPDNFFKKLKSNEVTKKSFIADDGIRYKWDDTEQDWLEDSDQESEDERNNDESEDDEEDEPINQSSENNQTNEINNDKKRKRKKKTKKGPNTWIYVNGLPNDMTEDEMKAHFSKVGLIAINPLDQQARIRLYREEDGTCKGDATIQYNAPESVQLAIDILHDGYIRPNFKISVTIADFSSHNQHFTSKSAKIITAAQRKVAQSAMKQALTWNEDDDIGISKAKGLKIVVLEKLFHPDDANTNSNSITFWNELEDDIASECSKFGELEKVTIFSSNPRGICIVRFKTAYAAQECIRIMDGRYFAGRRIKSYFWDGSTNYSITSHSNKILEDEEKQRLDEFGSWLESQQDDLPEEFQLRVES